MEPPDTHLQHHIQVLDALALHVVVVVVIVPAAVGPRQAATGPGGRRRTARCRPLGRGPGGRRATLLPLQLPLPLPLLARHPAHLLLPGSLLADASLLRDGGLVAVLLHALVHLRSNKQGSTGRCW
ncbi:MAG: hypothetical protein WDW38_009800 [Sanguina aurantia]